MRAPGSEAAEGPAAAGLLGAMERSRARGSGPGRPHSSRPNSRYVFCRCFCDSELLFQKEVKPGLELSRKWLIHQVMMMDAVWASWGPWRAPELAAAAWAGPTAPGPTPGYCTGPISQDFHAGWDCMRCPTDQVISCDGGRGAEHQWLPGCTASLYCSLFQSQVTELTCSSNSCGCRHGELSTQQM